MTVGILGLGLIGGSFARAYAAEGHTVLARDTDRTVFSFARLCGAVSGELNAETAACCDLILLCVYPGAAIDWLREMGEKLGPGPLVVDCCGTKRGIFAEGVALDKHALRAHMNKTLEAFKVPQEIEQVDRVARTYNGKLDRKAYL